MKKRTDIDFSKHILKITETDDVSIYDFKIPNTKHLSLTFINTCGVLTVTGDFGNYVFCREFHPSPENSVSDYYWDEKLQIHSIQKPHKYDSETTLEFIKEFKDSFEEIYGREMNEDESDWIDNLICNVDDETSYINIAYQETPSTIELDDVPFGKKRHYQLDIVYDGFDAMCEYLKNETNDKDIRK